MRSIFTYGFCALFALVTSPAIAQDNQSNTVDETEFDELDEDELDAGQSYDAGGLSMGDLAMPDIELPDDAFIESEEQESVVEESAEDRRAEANAEIADATAEIFREPAAAFDIRGYLRARGVLWNGFGLSRDRAEDPGAFRYFRVADRDVVPRGGCNSANPDPDNDPAGPDSCGGEDHHRFANMRLRLRPTLSLSESVRVHATIDVFDNMILGSTPDSSVYVPSSGASEQFTRARSPGVYTDIAATTQNPPQAYRNSLRDSIYVRRAWAEISQGGIGQLRFGRMGSHWGLGMLQNAGNDLDGDYSSDVDRILFATEAFGLTGFVSWDFSNQGVQPALLDDLRGVPFDYTNRDDERQITAALAWRTPEPEAQARLARGDFVLDIGAYIIARRQAFESTLTNPFSTDGGLLRRDLRTYTPDLWARFRWQGLRIEVEAALNVGQVRSNNPSEDPYRIMQFGLALEAEYHFPQLEGLYARIYTGFATGDRDMTGFSWHDDQSQDPNGDGRLTQFTFHPNYRVDLILWRHIMGRVAGAWYLRGGAGYDIIKRPDGQLFGLSADAIYSRAAFQAQSYGSNPNLGVELNLAAYYRSADGPGFTDGFYLSFQYGVLFPFQGLGYRSNGNLTEVPGGNPDLTTAQSLRLIFGVQY